MKQNRVLRVLVLVTVVAMLFALVPAVSAEGREEQLAAKIEQIISGIPSWADTQAKVALYLHDYVALNVAYEMVGDHQTAYGALLDGKAVCAGYADAYQHLLTAAGIEAYTIYGIADNGSGVPESHAWTMVMLDGNCVFTDVTWDDPFINGVQDPDYVTHTYFQITFEEMSRDHFPDEESLAMIPDTCGHTGYDYYSLMQGPGTGCAIFSESTTAQEAAPYVVYKGATDSGDSFFCAFRFEGEDPRSWVIDKWAGIAITLGLSGRMRVSYSISGNCVEVTVYGTLNTKVNVTSVSLSPTRLTFDAAGKTAQLTATVYPHDATDKTVTYSNRDIVDAVRLLVSALPPVEQTAMDTVQNNSHEFTKQTTALTINYTIILETEAGTAHYKLQGNVLSNRDTDERYVLSDMQRDELLGLLGLR